MSEPYICLVCLRTDRKLNEITSALSVYHDDLIDYSLLIDVPKYCTECEYLLKKCHNFQQKCIKAAKALNQWLKSSKMKGTSLDLLHLELPQCNLAVWTPENSKVFMYSADKLTPISNKVNSQKTLEHNLKAKPDINFPEKKKDEINDFPEHYEDLLKFVLHCDNNEVTRVSETKIFNKDSEDTTDIFQNNLSIDNTTPNYTISSQHVKENKIHEAEKNNKITKQSLKSMETEPNVKIKDKTISTCLNTKKRKLKTYLTKPTCDVPLTVNKPKTQTLQETNDLTASTKDNLKPTNDILIHKKNTVSNSNDDADNDLICLDDNVNDNDVVIIDDENDFDDESLNSDDDYLLTPFKKQKMKCGTRGLPRVEDLDENYINEENLLNSTIKKDSIIENLLNEENIVTKLKTMNDNLGEICKNWQMASLIDLRGQNITSDKTGTMCQEVLAKIISHKPNVQKLKKKSLYGNLAYISGELDCINEKYKNIINNYETNVLDLRERVKAELSRICDTWGDLETVDGTVYQKDTIINALDMVPERKIKRLLSYLAELTSCVLTRAGALLVRSIQNKHQDRECETVFDIQYLNTEQEMMAEFENRKTYECYLQAPYKCGVCYQGFKHKRLLEYHMAHHDVRSGPMCCKICNVRYLTQQRLKKHMLSHDAVYRCKLCPLVTYYRASMNNHYEQHIGKQYTCDKCGVTYKSKSVYVQHQSVAHPRGAHVCTTCGRCFVSAYGLKFHITKKHRGEDKAVVDDSYKCEECELSFTTQDALRVHLRTLHKRADSRVQTGDRKLRAPRNISLKPRKRPNMICRVCEAVGHSYGWMLRHVSSEHPTVDMALLYADKQTFLCDVCGKGYSKEHCLRDHMNIHNGVTFPCGVCGKRYPSRMSLNQHKLRHGPRSFCCQHCGRRFYSQANLCNHVRSHIGDRRFKCNICGKGFIHRAALNEHIRGVHKHERRVRKRGVIGKTRKVNEISRGVDETSPGVNETLQGVKETLLRVDETIYQNAETEVVVTTEEVTEALLGIE